MASSLVDENQSGSFRMTDPLACAGKRPSKSSILSKIDPIGNHVPQTSLLREDRLLGHSVEKRSGEQAEPAEHVKPKQGTLMRKLSWLINPKKKPPKSSAKKRASLSIQEGSGDAKDHLELLFAQAEATLGELLVRAGASFNAKSTTQEDHHPHPHYQHHHHERARSNGGSESTSVRLGGSFGRSGTLVGQGHTRRNSLSRVWQHLGGSLFCGSGHMNALVMEEMELRGIAPLPQTSSATYFGDGVDDDMAIDESYWQSLAASILMERQKLSDVNEHAIHHLDECNEHSIKDKMLETSHDCSVTSLSASQQSSIPSGEREAECILSEIMSVPSDADLQGRQEDACTWAACGMEECSVEDSPTPLPVPVEFGEGCTRLNTTLDASPNLAHNYQIHMKSRAQNGGLSSSRSKSVVELLNYHSCPVPALASDQVVEPQVAASSSSTACASSSNLEVTVHPTEDFLSHARGSRSEPNDTILDSPSDAVATGNSLDATAQQQLETANCTRVSLMTLLHEESVAVESVDAVNVVEEVGHVQAGVPQEEKVVGEEPLALLCCVCMVRRKGAALIPCGHTFCRICSKQLFAGRGACPLCNNLIVQLLDIF